jgi:hypothetical protein
MMRCFIGLGFLRKKLHPRALNVNRYGNAAQQVIFEV